MNSIQMMNEHPSRHTCHGEYPDRDADVSTGDHHVLRVAASLALPGSP